MRGGGILLDVWELGLEVPHNTSLHNTLAISSLLVPHRCKGVETGYFPINPRRNEMMGWVQTAVFAWKVSQHSDLITQTDESQDFIRRWYRYSKLLVAPQGRTIHPCHTDARLGCMTCGAPLCKPQSDHVTWFVKCVWHDMCHFQAEALRSTVGFHCGIFPPLLNDKQSLREGLLPWLMSQNGNDME